MNYIGFFGILILLSVFKQLESQKAKATRNVEITADVEKIRDPEGFAAIKELHSLIDDDHSGSIDRFESNDFLQGDLKLTGSDRIRRERAFHHDDDSITVDDMWESWFQSEERDWDEKVVLNWLINVVRLPQYEKLFMDHKVTGIALPRMAVQNSSFLISVLGIKNFVHRQKLQLKALDLVLFGFVESQSKFKDIVIGFMAITVLALGLGFRKVYLKNKTEVESLSKKLSELSSMETDFEGVNKGFGSGDSNTTDDETVNELKMKLEEAEKRLEMAGSEGISYTLQPLLRRTYETEINFVNEKRLACLAEMKEAKEFVDRMRRKQSSLMNSLKLATGATVGETESVDAKVLSLKQRMSKIKQLMDECQHRWIEIETTCGFSVIGNYAKHNYLINSGSSQGLRNANTTYTLGPPSLATPMHGSAGSLAKLSKSESRKDLALRLPQLSQPSFCSENSSTSSLSNQTKLIDSTSTASTVPVSIRYPVLKELKDHNDTRSISSQSTSSLKSRLNSVFKRNKTKT